MVVAKKSFLMVVPFTFLLRRSRRRFALRPAWRSGEYTLSAGQRDVARVGHLRSVFGHRTADGDLVADLQRGACPPLADEDVGTGEFEIPRCHRTVGVFDIDVETSV